MTGPGVHRDIPVGASGAYSVMVPAGKYTVTGGSGNQCQAAGGIQVHVEDLAAHLAGQERCDAEARFGELLPAYQDLASNIGLP